MAGTNAHMKWIITKIKTANDFDQVWPSFKLLCQFTEKLLAIAFDSFF